MWQPAVLLPTNGRCRQGPGGLRIVLTEAAPDLPGAPSRSFLLAHAVSLLQLIQAKLGPDKKARLVRAAPLFNLISSAPLVVYTEYETKISTITRSLQNDLHTCIDVTALLNLATMIAPDRDQECKIRWMGGIE